jgi:hypothetical protein
VFLSGPICNGRRALELFVLDAEADPTQLL